MSLESFLREIRSLPAGVRKNLSQIEERDREVQYRDQEAARLVEQYQKNIDTNTRLQRVAAWKEIEEHYDRITVLADEKVELANDTYELVDAQIRKLDEEATKSVRRSATAQSEEKAGPSGAGAEKKKGRKRKVEEKKEKAASSGSSVTDMFAAAVASVTGPPTGGGLDMPVDPNEPTYCVCRDVSYGEMIGCDNQDCPVEWFHFNCVGLASKPEGKWFCPHCVTQEKH